MTPLNGFRRANPRTNTSYRSHRSYRIYIGNEGFILSNSNPTVGSNYTSANYNPTVFLQLNNTKPCCALNCNACQALISKNAIHAVLLNNTRTEIFATDAPPIGVEGVGADYWSKSCGCRITDLACLSCGNIIGYALSSICPNCTSEHQWRFHSDTVTFNESLDFHPSDIGAVMGAGITDSVMEVESEFPGR
ncbi:hypothetical protein K493DRAFT_268030 [Basidiobolus meristosporus CBS 931.73]|uniref:Protein FAM72 n=1 Tax=Basidiobolus meristosporus CBS 931.73 TaxID=1314790 RepID=A0A1Y1XSF6_9FUNG|nr:hypothetical protein K493DRAFT_268030 [Basidiobolus meristosporus CBS 931.73]|eukprot:ORX88670.1 hypothetical protein K493DRAFT_268030 [Basidiobolus meristosporus CBS 931.73]